MGREEGEMRDMMGRGVEKGKSNLGGAGSEGLETGRKTEDRTGRLGKSEGQRWGRLSSR